MPTNNLVVITCHCNNEEKEKLLLKNIDEIKSHGFDILISSHLPIPVEIQNKVEYTVYDKSNPILNYPYRGIAFWKTLILDKRPIKIQNVLDDYGWTAFNQIFNAANLALPLQKYEEEPTQGRKWATYDSSFKYDYFSFINYDIELTENIIGDLKNPLPILTSRVKDNFNETGYRFPSFMLNIFDRNHLEKLVSLFDMQFYMQDTHPHIVNNKFTDAEHYFKHLISLFDYVIHPDDIKDLMLFEDNTLFNKSGTKDFKVFIQNDNTFKKLKSNSWIPRLFVYDVKVNVINIKVNDKTYTLEKDKSIILDLPKIKKLGIEHGGCCGYGEYLDLLEEYKAADYSFINYLDEK